MFKKCLHFWFINWWTLIKIRASVGTAGEQSMVRNDHVYTANGLPTVNAYTAFSLPTLTLYPRSLYPRSLSTHGQSLPTVSRGHFGDSLPTVSLSTHPCLTLYPRSVSPSQSLPMVMS